MNRRPFLLVSALALALAPIAAACSGDDAAEPPATTVPPETTTTAPLPRYPLTDLPDAAAAAAQHPAIVVKIDNGIRSRPQTGLVQADIVFEEEVEGVTRLASVFHSTLPDIVGNVRSARSSDVDIVAQLSTPLFSWSGGNLVVTNEILGAASAGILTNASVDLAESAYVRSPDRVAPYNLYVHPTQLLDLRAPEGQGPPAPIFGFRTEEDGLPPSALPAFGVSIPFTRGVAVTYVWNDERSGWDRFQVDSEHGEPDSAFVDVDGVQVSPANVVVLSTPYGVSAADRNSPQAFTVGEGDAYVFTDGAMVPGRWVRPDASQPAQLLDADGNPILLSPGRTWVELPRTTVPVTAIDQATADRYAAFRR